MNKFESSKTKIYVLKVKKLEKEKSLKFQKENQVRKK